MRNKVFNTPFENMLRILLLSDALGHPANIDRLAALDFICIFGQKCKVLDKNLHGNNEFGFSEFSTKRERIKEAIKIAIRDGLMTVEKSDEGFTYSINKRGREMVQGVQSSYAKSYVIGAKIVCNRFFSYTDEEILKYICELSITTKGV